MPSTVPNTVSSILDLSMSTMKSVGNLARTNLYQVSIESVGTEITAANGQVAGETFASHLENNSFYGVTFDNTLKTNLSFLCAEATLPASTYATAEVKDNFMGVTQEFAHTRINTDIDFTFYIDRNYTVLAFFEAWMDYISGGNNPNLTPPEPSLDDENLVTSGNYYRRFKYPKQYKTSAFYIRKFERDYKESNTDNLVYRLINAFPKSMTSIPISYGEAEIMKVTITMNYDRYIIYRDYTPYDINTDPTVGANDLFGTSATTA